MLPQVITAVCTHHVCYGVVLVESHHDSRLHLACMLQQRSTRQAFGTLRQLKQHNIAAAAATVVNSANASLEKLPLKLAFQHLLTTHRRTITVLSPSLAKTNTMQALCD
jgi:hypothetical protein